VSFRRSAARVVTAIFVIAAAINHASAAWVRVSVGKADTYVDPITKPRTGDQVTMSEMTDYKKIIADSEFPYQSVKRQHEFDCKDRQLRALSMATYSDRMGKGHEVLTAAAHAPSWTPVIAGSVGEIMWKAACARRARAV